MSYDGLAAIIESNGIRPPPATIAAWNGLSYWEMSQTPECAFAFKSNFVAIDSYGTSIKLTLIPVSFVNVGAMVASAVALGLEVTATLIVTVEALAFAATPTIPTRPNDEQTATAAPPRTSEFLTDALRRFCWYIYMSLLAMSREPFTKAIKLRWVLA